MDHAVPAQRQAVAGETSESLVRDHAGQVARELGGLGWFTKLSLASLILAACYGFVRAYRPRTSRMTAGRHGAYEKAGMA